MAGCSVTAIGDFCGHVKSHSSAQARINFRRVAVVTHCQDAVVLQRSKNGGGASRYCDEDAEKEKGDA